MLINKKEDEALDEERRRGDQDSDCMLWGVTSNGKNIPSMHANWQDFDYIFVHCNIVNIKVYIYIYIYYDNGIVDSN